MLCSYDYRRLRADIKQTPTRRKYQRAFLALAKLLQQDYIPISHGGCTDEGESCLFWNTKIHYCDIYVNPSGQSFSVFIKERETIRTAKEWYFENITLQEFTEDWLTRFLEPFKRKDHVQVQL